MKISKRRIIIYLVLFFFPLIMLFSQTEEASKILEQNKESVVSLIVYGENKEEIGKGTGFSVKNNEIIIAGYNLISNAISVEGKNFKGKKVKVEGIISADKEFNIALLKIKGKVPACTLGNSDELEMGKRVFALGSNEAREIVVSEGTVFEFIEITPFQRLVKLSLSMQQSFSGGPLLNLDGQVMGVNFDLGKGLQFTVPINKIKQSIKSGKVVDFKTWNHEGYLSSYEGAFLAGRLYSLINEPNRALSYLEKVVKSKPDNIEAHAHLASVYTKLRSYESAVSSYKKVIQLDEKRDDAHYGLGLTYVKMRRPNDAVSPLKKAVDLNPNNMEGYYELGSVYEDLRDFAKAAEMYEDYINLKPETMWAGYLRLGLCRAELGQFEEAIAAFKEALKEKPVDVKINYNLAEAYYKSKQYDKAAEAYNKLMQINPEQATTYYGKKVKMYDEAGMFDNAIEAAKQVCELNPESELAVYNLGIMYSKQGKYNESIETFRHALTIRPNYDLAYYNIGLNYFNLKKFKEAVEAFEKFVAITPDNADAWYNIGVGYMQLKKFDKSLEPLRKSIELRPDYDYAHYNLAITYLNLQDSYSAREVYKTLLNINPELAQKLKKYLK
ncbi:MAG: tetratricopeptide repeat protein [Candidatus Aminicenantaceae bacterium]